ncbi:N-acetylmuramoyl-L-alanine amidase [Allonocardiopsis opalescens]|uniref:N-acetylmuramoyl-L-alanine amidase n=1 Tax=Allonocardiopsis opalescens TaxID=1144618 RepID=A0A2T0QAM1_9ACTN|nr:N-acetylmuramoyl-L-alanine amidase [Allonocardiopsis opalescens]PRY00919.1 N-acetylmuramoyl-L-alanine amidase [Allonocardiopsis opalescens]
MGLFTRGGAGVLAAVLVLAAGCGPGGGEPSPSAGSPAAAPGGSSAPPPGAVGEGTRPPGAVPPTGSASAPAPARDALDGAVIAVDPGHNGGNAAAAEQIAQQVPAGPDTKECDTVGAETDSGYAEHAFNYDVALRLTELLEARGAEVVLTRHDDDGVGPCVNERAEIGNEAGADAAVSIHADGGPDGGGGFHVIVPERIEGYTDAIAEPSARLGRSLRDAFHEVTGQPYSDYTAEDGLDVRGDLGGLNLSTVPKVFLEVGNMRNADDAALMTDPEWRQLAAEGIAAGLADYLG